MKNINSFNARQTVSLNNKKYTIYSLANIAQAQHLPFATKIILENLLRHEDGVSVTKETINKVINKKSSNSAIEIAYNPSRVLMQDFTGVPAIADLAAMRDSVQQASGNPEIINPIKPTDLVIDHSVQVDNFGNKDALKNNVDIEFKRNIERYKFLNWGQKAFSNLTVVPPGVGIVHQVNLEKLARVVFENDDADILSAYPDTVVGTDSHTTMVNGIGVLGWGVGGIEAESVMLGQPVSMLVPDVVGFKMHGKLPTGTTSTDLVLTITQILRNHGVVNKFVEFYGSALSDLSVADRATISNMAPEYGATCGLFPIDSETLNYLRLTSRSAEKIALIESYYRAQNMFYEAGSSVEAKYDEYLELDLSSIKPSMAGPKRPQDIINLTDIKKVFVKEQAKINNKVNDVRLAKINIDGTECSFTDGDIAIAAITSCTNTSNPSVMVGAGLVAKKAVELGLKVKPWVKTSFGPGSQAVSLYLKEMQLLEPLEKIGFNVVGYGCTTCIGNSGPLIKEVGDAINNYGITAVSVLSGNRNFEGRVHSQVKMNFLGSPLLVVAYALAGTINIDITKDAIATDNKGNDVYLKDIWPSDAELKKSLDTIHSEQFSVAYTGFLEGNANWQQLDTDASICYSWDKNSTYIQKPPFFANTDTKLTSILDARALAVLGDSVTTDHISPAGSIAIDSPAALYLQANGVDTKDFNSYGARRGNHNVMLRGTFANIRLRNNMVDVEGGHTLHIPSNKQMSIYDASLLYKKENTPMIVLAGKEYGTGSSRDWAAKGVKLLGVKAIIAESFERIHRSNLVGMGVLPLEFIDNQSATTLGLTGSEIFSILAIDQGRAKQVKVIAQQKDKKIAFNAKVRIDTPKEIEYFNSDGILPFVLQNLLLAEQN